MKPRPHIPHETWERLSALQDGDLPADEAEALAADPALADAIAALEAQTSALRAPLAAPAGFADRVFAAVEHEPIPANRPWWRRTETALLAVAAAAVLWVAIQPLVPPAPPSAPGQIALPRRPVATPVQPTEEATPATAAPAPGPKPTSTAKPVSAPPEGIGEAVAPAPVVPADPAGGTAEPEPAWVKPAGYRLQATDPSVLARLPQAAARLGAHLEDDQGNPLPASALTDFQGAVFLTIPADRLPELDAELRRIGAVSSWRDAEQLHGATLDVQVNVVLP